MKCESCGKKTKVVDSRHCDSTTSFRGQALIRDRVAWYTNDWVYRRRKCLGCGDVVLTVELSLDDLENGWTPRD